MRLLQRNMSMPQGSCLMPMIVFGACKVLDKNFERFGKMRDNKNEFQL